MPALETVRERVGRRLREIREHAGLSQSAVAELLGVQRAVVGRIEAGTRALAVDELYVLSIALDVSPRAFVRSGDDDVALTITAHHVEGEPQLTFAGVEMDDAHHMDWWAGDRLSPRPVEGRAVEAAYRFERFAGSDTFVMRDNPTVLAAQAGLHGVLAAQAQTRVALLTREDVAREEAHELWGTAADRLDRSAVQARQQAEALT